jgi:ribulose-5-phosphate 4-epimerase/fuculose-1-phosphate aldolase
MNSKPEGDAYVGVKFSPLCEGVKPPKNSKIKKVREWGKILDEKNMAPTYATKKGIGSSGNMSFKTKNGFIITASYSQLGSLSKQDFTEVTECDSLENTVCFNGSRNPSSESSLHYAIYEARPEVKAIMHFHDESVLRQEEKLGLPITQFERPYGTVELAQEVLKVLGRHEFIIMKNHGCLALGKTIDEAGKTALEVHKKALKLEKA